MTGTVAAGNAVSDANVTVIGVNGEDVTVVQETSGGTWDIVGSREQYNVTIYLVPRNATGNSTLALTSQEQTFRGKR
ncbi:hypothetical protein [Trinickia mobilis]|uniref:hypothetical protein n=1 Tax=Trinickia mobilis TaxID=2816356 RepID=UPI001A8D7957|nr:hypothetical protein [Trinickia mobilis]